MIIAIIILLCLIVLLLITSFVMGIFGVPYTPSSWNVAKVLEKENLIKDHMKVVELGSGDARLIGYFFRKYDIEAKGYEISPILYIISRIYAHLSNRFFQDTHKIHIHYKSMYKADISQADIVYCYLFPGALKKLLPSFSTMRKGAKIVSYKFKIENLNLIDTLFTPSGYKIYIYEI